MNTTRRATVNNGKALITIAHKGPRPFVDSLAASLNHHLDEERQRRTSGTIRRINDKNASAKLTLRSFATEAKKASKNTTVFGTMNPNLCPIRNEKTILNGSASIMDP